MPSPRAAKLSGVSGILAITVGVPNSLGPLGELLQHYGTGRAAGSTIFAAGLARGQEIPCLHLGLRPGSGFRCGRDSGYRVKSAHEKRTTFCLCEKSMVGDGPVAHPI